MHRILHLLNRHYFASIDILVFLPREVTVFFSSAIVNLLFTASLQALQEAGNSVKFSHNFLEGQCIRCLYWIPLAGEGLIWVFVLWSMSCVCESELGHPEDLEEKLCCSECVSSARCSLSPAHRCAGCHSSVWHG